MTTRTTYRDFWLRFITSIVLAFFFVFLGSDSLADVAKGKYFVADVLSGFTLTFIVTSYISIVTAHLDNQYPWNKYLTTRLLYQVVAGVVVPSMFVLAFMYTYLIVILGFQKGEVNFFYTEFPISILFITFWNVLYVGFFFFRENTKNREELLTLKEKLFTLQNVDTGTAAIPTLQEQATIENGDDEADYREAGSGTKIRILVAVSGNRNIPIPVENIAYFYKSGNYTTLKTFQSETYLLNHSLDELMKLLEESLFFRANRQFIINIRSCHYFTNEEYGKLAVKLEPEFEEEVSISQKRAAAFREWLHT